MGRRDSRPHELRAARALAGAARWHPARAERQAFARRSARGNNRSGTARDRRRDTDLDEAIHQLEWRNDMTSTTHIHRWRAFALLAVAYFMTVVDFTIVNVSLPTIGRDLHLS